MIDSPAEGINSDPTATIPDPASAPKALGRGPSRRGTLAGASGSSHRVYHRPARKPITPYVPNWARFRGLRRFLSPGIANQPQTPLHGGQRAVHKRGDLLVGMPLQLQQGDGTQVLV